MNKLKKRKLILIISTLLLISTIILILGYCGKVFGWTERWENRSVWTWLMDNKQGWFCIEKGPSMARGTTQYHVFGTFSYRSDSKNQAERALAYIIKDAYDHNDAGYRYSGGSSHQQALWKLLANYRSALPDFNHVNPTGIGGSAGDEIYNTALSQQPIPYSEAGEASFETSKFEIESNVGKMTILNIKGKVKSIEVEWEISGKRSDISRRFISNF